MSVAFRELKISVLITQVSYIPRSGESSRERREEAKAELLMVLHGKDWHTRRETRRNM